MKLWCGEIKGGIHDPDGCPFLGTVFYKEKCLLNLKKSDCNYLAEFIEAKVIQKLIHRVFDDDDDEDEEG
jgi:hypothetical protein